MVSHWFWNNSRKFIICFASLRLQADSTWQCGGSLSINNDLTFEHMLCQPEPRPEPAGKLI